MRAATDEQDESAYKLVCFVRGEITAQRQNEECERGGRGERPIGASRSEVMPWIDRSVWVQSDLDETERRGIARDGGTEEARRFWHEWMTEEFDFLQRQRSWERATIIVNGSPAQPYDPSSEVIVSPALH